jgi:type III restriction enzyme
MFHQDEIKRRILIMLNMNKVIQHLWNLIRSENTEILTPIFDKENPIRSTSHMRTWYTSKPCEPMVKSHINLTVYDSQLEANEALILNESDLVKSFVKNDHLGFNIVYNYKGVIHKYYPDFLIKLCNDEHMVLETKGVDDDQNRTKRSFLDLWVKAVNQHGGFGRWHCDVSFSTNDLINKLQSVIDHQKA